MKIGHSKVKISFVLSKLQKPMLEHIMCTITYGACCSSTCVAVNFGVSSWSFTHGILSKKSSL